MYDDYGLDLAQAEYDRQEPPEAKVVGAYQQGIEVFDKSLKIATTKVLQLSADGNYILHNIEPDFSTFLNCYTIFNFHED